MAKTDVLSYDILLNFYDLTHFIFIVITYINSEPMKQVDSSVCLCRSASCVLICITITVKCELNLHSLSMYLMYLTY